ncbi:hypothetical protein Oweho_2989 [Owenweeksia hongkongensis DSM 17368]|uniref:Uncharacterized protein n=1 Tax=Owenweeksia hongkongensis (strain DSM 17368 / CIP 108786 / JCM 12287 / NRRL B-23963 / UST20020801) TaxID=926562 RepID=G8R1Z4_OWEHD|nr:hypothetical protein Oweho_2989 [Owenweeksia hongkongensis DSM 17368]
MITTEKDLIHRLNWITTELLDKKRRLQKSSQLKINYRKKLLSQINELSGQRQTLENLLVIG